MTKAATTRPQSMLQAIDLIAVLVRKDLAVKYRNSLIGYGWSMLNPLLTMIVISFVFSFLVRGIKDYPLFVLSGLLMWNFILSSVSLAAGSVLGGAGLLKKVKMQAWILPIAPVFSMATNMILAFVPYVLLFAYMGPEQLPVIWLFPFFLLILLMFVSGICLAVASLNVSFRDIGHMIDPIFQVFFYATPIIYDRHSDMIPPRIRDYLAWNPFTHYVEFGRKVVFWPKTITPEELTIVTLLAVASLVSGWLIYRWRRPTFIFNL